MHCNNGQLILRKILIIVANRCHFLRLKCTKFDFGWGSAPDPAGGAYSAPQTPQLDLLGPTSKGRQGREGKGRGKTVVKARRKRGRKRGRRGRGRKAGGSRRKAKRGGG